MANKQDLMSALSADEISTALNLQDMRDRVWQILPCSAMTGEGLQESMEWIVDQINTTCGKPDASPAAEEEAAVKTA